MGDDQSLFSTSTYLSSPTLSLYATGTIDLNLDTDDGFVLGGALGWEVGDDFSLEFELARRSNDGALDAIVTGTVTYASSVYYGPTSFEISQAEVKVLSIMANAWYEFDTDTKWTPYVGGGIGLAKVDIDSSFGDVSVGGFAYQLGIGLGYHLSKRTRMGLEYRYFAAPGIDVSDEIDYEYAAHSVMVSFKFSR